MRTFEELIEQWKTENRVTNEGSSAVRDLEEFCRILGYKHGTFLGSEVSLMNFLADNPGAIEAIYDWIAQQELDSWRESLEDEIGPEDKDDEDEDDDDDK